MPIVLEYLGYIPKLQFGQDYMGVYTQKYRGNMNLNQEEFSRLTRVSLENIIELETGIKKKSLDPISKKLKELFALNYPSLF